jgi:hypothetical protein
MFYEFTGKVSDLIKSVLDVYMKLRLSTPPYPPHNTGLNFVPM